MRDGGRLEECRAVFGDDSQDYDAALQTHYQNGAPADWQEHFVSQYASTHPWEDWAETWAHYLHIVDTLEMASAFGITVQPRLTRDEALTRGDRPRSVCAGRGYGQHHRRVAAVDVRDEQPEPGDGTMRTFIRSCCRRRW